MFVYGYLSRCDLYLNVWVLHTIYTEINVRTRVGYCLRMKRMDKLCKESIRKREKSNYDSRGISTLWNFTEITSVIEVCLQ